MKRLHLCLLALASIMLASCGGHSPLKISEKEILKQCNKNLVEMGQDSSVVKLDVGYYEQNDENERLKLEKLKAAGIINYDVTRYAWWTINEGWYTTYTFNEHFMVDVSLTEATQKYALNGEPCPKLKEKEDRDFRQPIYYDSLYPENKVKELSENWPEIPHPLANEVYRKCKALFAEVKAMLDETTDDAYLKPEQKLNTYYRIDHLDCLTKAQKEELDQEMDGLWGRINQMKGNEAFAKQKKIIDESMTVLNNAKSCYDLDKAAYKMKGLSWITNTDKMSQSQSAEISTLSQRYNELILSKSNEFGCNKPVIIQNIKEEEYEDEVDYELPDYDEDMDPQAIAYREAKDKENKTEAILFACIKKAVVARDIKLIQGEDGVSATAEVIYELRKVTDAERAFNRILNKTRVKGDATFNYYCDKGWVIEGAEIEESVAETPYSETKINLSGTIGGDMPICMSLTIASTGQVRGAYYYKKSGPNALLYLNGSKEGDRLTLNETNAKGKQTGTYEGTFKGNIYQGEFESYRGATYVFTLLEDKRMATIDF